MTKEYYNPEDLPKFNEYFAELGKQSDKLAEELVLHEFKTPKGKEYALHGFSRRRKIIWQCITNVFSAIPPDLVGIPNSEEINNATISLHAFYVNAFGACDNLAWVLVYEKKLRKPDGGELPAKWIGLRKANKAIRNGLSCDLVLLLGKFECWFEHVDNFRHSLAHRVPLYVPPYVVSNKNEAEYVRLDKEAWEALRAGDLETNKRLRVEQQKLTDFRPWFTHSFSEKSPHMAIHPQLIADFGALLEIAEGVIAELRK